VIASAFLDRPHTKHILEDVAPVLLDPRFFAGDGRDSSSGADYQNCNRRRPVSVYWVCPPEPPLVTLVSSAWRLTFFYWLIGQIPLPAPFRVVANVILGLAP